MKMSPDHNRLATGWGTTHDKKETGTQGTMTMDDEGLAMEWGMTDNEKVIET
jgi:hypothetical protein